jgi:hypothetical protein
MVTVVAVLAVAVAAGAVIQGSIGFGYALLAVPAMVLLLAWTVRVTPLFLALSMTLLMSAREWRSIDLGGFALIIAGRLFGTVGGVVLLVLAPKGFLSMLTGSLILTAALGSFLNPTFEVNKRTRLAGGVASGVVGTVATLGGTSLALVYQDRSGQNCARLWQSHSSLASRCRRPCTFCSRRLWVGVQLLGTFRQQLIPEPQPISFGSISQGMPLFSTKMMPVRAARSSMRGLPPSGLGSSGGNSGSTISQSSSLTNSLAIFPIYPDILVLKDSLRWLWTGAVSDVHCYLYSPDRAATRSRQKSGISGTTRPQTEWEAVDVPRGTSPTAL